MAASPHSDTLQDESLFSDASLARSVQTGLKHILDRVAAALLLVAFAPVFALVTVLVGMDGGPVMFSHRRVGRNGKAFGCLKFRTMVAAAEELLPEYLRLHPAAAEEWRREQKLVFDPRVTGVGKLLRRTSLDELPQLWNVLRGEMSLVGPRPVTRGEIDTHYSRCAGVITSVKPGLTGLWQVSGRNDVGYEKRVALDLRYVKSWNLLEDFRILLKTADVVLSRSGAR